MQLDLTTWLEMVWKALGEADVNERNRLLDDADRFLQDDSQDGRSFAADHAA